MCVICACNVGYVTAAVVVVVEVEVLLHWTGYSRFL